MLSLGWKELLAVTSLALFLLEVAAIPSPYGGFPLDDIRRPIYRGNMRYNSDSLPFDVEKKVVGNIEKFNSDYVTVVNMSSSFNYTSFRINGSRKNDEEIATRKNEDYNQINSAGENTWSLVLPPLGDSDRNHSRLVQNFLKNSLRTLTTNLDTKVNLLEETSHESLDNLILSHTVGPRPIQMYPEKRPSNWDSKPHNPTHIIIEDVHPSKLPKPPHNHHWGGGQYDFYDKYHMHYNHGQVETWGQTDAASQWTKPQKPGSSVILVENVHSSQLPKPEHTLGSYGSELTSVQLLTTTKPAYTYQQDVIHKPILLQPQSTFTQSSQASISDKPYYIYSKPLGWPSKPHNPQLTKPTTPSVLHEIQISTSIPSRPSTTWPSKPHLEAVVSVQNFQDHIPPTPIHPTHYTPIYTTHKPEAGESKPIFQPIYMNPNPEPSPEPPPKPLIPISPVLNESNRPPEAPYRYPPIYPNHPLGSAIVVSQTTLPPPVTLINRPSPPSIIILEDVSDPPSQLDCGTLHITQAMKNKKECSDVFVLLNSPVAVSEGGPAVASGIYGPAIGAGGPGAGSVEGVAAGNGSAGIGVASNGSILVSGQQTLEFTAPGSTSTLETTDVPVTPVLHPILDDDEYPDYDVTTSSPTTSRPSNRPTSNGPTSVTLFNYLTSSLPLIGAFLGPFSVSLWVIFLGPLAFLLVGVVGVGALLVPWILPRLFFRRRRRRSLFDVPEISDTAHWFLKNLDNGKYDNYDWRRL